MKTIITVLVGIASLVPVIGSAAFGDPLADKAIRDILEGFIQAVMYIGVVALAAFIVWTGFLFVAAQGSEDGLRKAKQMAIWVSIGGAIILGMWLIYTLVDNTLASLSSAGVLIIVGAFLAYVLFKKK